MVRPRCVIASVFAYRAIISPPRDWDRWGELIRAFTAHLVERYGLAEVRDHWGFEVWNEPNLEVFWSGTPDEYLRLYEVTARAVKSVHPSLRLGGPATAAAGWVEELLDYAAGRGPNRLPVDFVSTHTYGSPPLDLRPLLWRHGRAGMPVWWTEWGVAPRHFERSRGRATAPGAWSRRGPPGTRTGGTVAMWNSTLDQSKTAGDPLLDRVVAVEIRGLGAASYLLRHYRVDIGHSNLAAVWERMGDGRSWPDEEGWHALHEADRLDQLHPPQQVSANDGMVRTEFELPMPAVSLLELVPR